MEWGQLGLSALIGGAITALGNFVIGLRKQKTQDDLAINSQAMQFYIETLKEIKKDKDNQEKDLAQINKSYLEVREKNAAMVSQIKYLELEIERLKKQK